TSPMTASLVTRPLAMESVVGVITLPLPSTTWIIPSGWPQNTSPISIDHPRQTGPPTSPVSSRKRIGSGSGMHVDRASRCRQPLKLEEGPQPPKERGAVFAFFGRRTLCLGCVFDDAFSLQLAPGE